jgi:hypothetical protein
MPLVRGSLQIGLRLAGVQTRTVVFQRDSPDVKRSLRSNLVKCQPPAIRRE